MNAKISEIFNSIQGEGKYAGVAQVFVRFFECNMHCDWCDTPNSIGDGKREFKEYSFQQLFDTIQPLWRQSHSVSLTGGEPLVQKDFIKGFIPFLKKAGMRIYLETNGIFTKELNDVIDDIDFIAMDIKLPSSTRCRAYWEEHKEFLKVAKQKDVFIKAVVTSDTKEEDLKIAVDLVAGIDPSIVFFLQPNHFEIRNGALPKCLAFQNYGSRYLKDVRVLPQVHKFIKMR
ncbi:MAG TPA: 7-carboxy-7-deazaguanine synthase QueE [Candidatus Omnitrophota bacterium]|nr:7-carboxy-7-deazaguanine synthase QueE [Candidatus Omnitrophota bacterium]